MSAPKISIITPSFNQGMYLEETILSIIGQNYPNLEYIIIDGGSTDNSVEIIKKYEKHLAYWVSEKDKGQSDAINKGFKKATGEIVCWLNSDDILVENALLNVANFFSENPDMDVVNGNLILIDKSSNILSGYFILKQKNWYAKRGIYYISQPSMFWKRRVIDSIGLLREDLHTQMDKEFLIRIFENNFKIGRLEKILAGFRIHIDSKGALGAGSEINVRDVSKLEKLYSQRYVQRPNLLFQSIYGLEKLFKGLYLRKYLFDLKWKGKNVKDLKYNSSSHLK